MRIISLRDNEIYFLRFFFSLFGIALKEKHNEAEVNEQVEAALPKGNVFYRKYCVELFDSV